MRILYIVNVGGFMNFFKYIIPNLVSEGNTIDIVCNTSLSPVDSVFLECGCKVFNVDFQRNPLKTKNFKAIKVLKKIIANGNYDIVHCHSGIQGVLGRLACKKFRKKGIKVFYTPHGFNFSKTSSTFSWIKYYLLEKHLAKYTDSIITMNNEEFSIANKFKGPKVMLGHGVGIDLNLFKNNGFDSSILKRDLGIKENDISLISVGELTKRKNHIRVIKALKRINSPHIKYFIVGKGVLYDYLAKKIARYGLSNNVKLLGFRNDIKDLLKCMDAFVFPSLLEGLPVSVIEAMASGLPCIVSKISGNIDLIDDGAGGFLCDLYDKKSFENAILRLINDRTAIKKDFGKYNALKAANYSNQIIYEEIKSAYHIV